jgi:hypothetical protein
MKFIKERLTKELYVDAYKKAKPVRYKEKFVLTTAIRMKLLNFRGMQALLRSLILKGELSIPVVDKEGEVVRNYEVFVFCFCVGIVPEVIYL